MMNVFLIDISYLVQLSDVTKIFMKVSTSSTVSPFNSLKRSRSDQLNSIRTVARRKSCCSRRFCASFMSSNLASAYVYLYFSSHAFKFLFASFLIKRLYFATTSSVLAAFVDANLAFKFFS